MQTVSSQFVAAEVSVTGHPKSKIGENDLLAKVFNINESEFTCACASQEHRAINGPVSLEGTTGPRFHDISS